MRRARRATALTVTALATAAGLILGSAAAGATPPAAIETPTVSAPNSPQALGPFSDVTANHKFAREINWMHEAGLSTGIHTSSGPAYMPSDRLSREAMAAFMFRKYADQGYQSPERSWFNDLQPGDKFYREISWMYEYGLSTGVNNEYDGRIYQPKQKLSREAMAAFMYRALHRGGYVAPAGNLIDVNSGDRFSSEIAWMFEAGLSTGVKTPAGTAYLPKGKLSREAMAAFMYRSQSMPADIVPIPNPTPPPPPKPRPKPPVTPPPVTPPPISPPPVNTTPFKNCTEAWNAGQAPLNSHHPRYAPKLDRDRDGWACEIDPR